MINVEENEVILSCDYAGCEREIVALLMIQNATEIVIDDIELSQVGWDSDNLRDTRCPDHNGYDEENSSYTDEEE